MSSQAVHEDGRVLWLLDEPAADATWDPSSGVLVVHVVGGESPQRWTARLEHPAREVPAGVRVDLPAESPLDEVCGVVAAVAEGDAWRERHCWGCGVESTRLVRPSPGHTARACEPCELLMREEASLAPTVFAAELDAGPDIGIWARQDTGSLLREVAHLREGRRSLGRLVSLLTRTAVPLLALPLWTPWTGGRGVVALLGLWGIVGVSLVSGPPWLSWTAGAVAVLAHLVQWPLATGALGGPRRRPGWPRKVLPELFELADRGGAAVGAQPIDRIQLLDDMTVSGHDHVYDDGPTRVLSVGRAALTLLSPDEIELLMALALASMEQRRAPAARVADAWTDRWHQVLYTAERAGATGAFARLAAAVVPQLMAMRAALYQCEVPGADQRVVAAYGPERFAATLVRQHALQRLLPQALWFAGRQWAVTGRAGAPQFEGALREGVRLLPAPLVRRTIGAVSWERAPWWEQRPSLGERLARLESTDLEVEVQPAAEALPLRRDLGLDRLDGWLLQSFRLRALAHERAQELLQPEPLPSAAAGVVRAILLHEVGAVPEALDSLEQVLQREPSHALGHRYRLRTLSHVGGDAELATAARAAVRLCGDPEALGLAAEALRQLGDLAGAIEAVSRGVEVAPNDAERSRLTVAAQRLQRETDRSSASPGLSGPSFQMKPSST